MSDPIIMKLVGAAIAVAKDILQNRVEEKNRELLEEKRAQAQNRRIDTAQISKIVLDANEETMVEITVSQNEAYAALVAHQDSVRTWADRIGFNDLREEKSISQIYIDLDIYLTPARSHLDPIEKSHTKPLRDAIFSGSRHSVILGLPGAGKTTSMRKLCASYSVDSGGPHRQCSFPLLVRLRDLEVTKSSGNSVVLAELSRLFPGQLRVKDGRGQLKFSEEKQEYRDHALIAFINELKPLIVLDGFDEIPSRSLRETIVRELRRLVAETPKARIVLTCRTGEFKYKIVGMDTFEIAPLNVGQIHSFARKWIGSDNEADNFLEAVKNSPFSDTAIKPLTLAHLCAIFERIGKVPDRPKTVYRKVVGLLLEEWDEQRSVKRLSKYSKFESDRKFEFLSALAYHLTVSLRTTVFGKAQLVSAYRQIHENFALPKEQGALVASEVESHTGLFVQTGYESYEFAHKSLQEYLAAEYLVKLPSIPRNTELLDMLANELAIAIAISSHPSLYFVELVLGRLSGSGLPRQFYDVFISRLSQEKPDFYEAEELILALFVLFSHWVCEGKITARAIRPRRISKGALASFMLFFRGTEAKLIKGALAKYYYTSSETRLEVSNIVLLQTRRCRSHPAYNLPTFILQFEDLWS